MQHTLASDNMNEHVSTDAVAAPKKARSDRAIAWWLLVCCALVFAMVVLGGVTRLTGSGLSMVNWKPVSGVLPPLSRAAWEREFEHYRQTPEYKYVNKGMSLSEFKGIFWFEYAHRVLGRLIGVVFLLPFLYFLLRRRIEASLVPKLAVMFVLGGLQGLLGWYMVKSGLVDDPHVSQYRLAAHLGLAVLIYAFMLWTALGILRSDEDSGSRGSSSFSTYTLILTIAVFVVMMSGAFVAGLKAGFSYNTFPLMAGQWIPDGRDVVHDTRVHELGRESDHGSVHPSGDCRRNISGHPCALARGAASRHDPLTASVAACSGDCRRDSGGARNLDACAACARVAGCASSGGRHGAADGAARPRPRVAPACEADRVVSFQARYHALKHADTDCRIHPPGR
jgi:heme A synthase